MGCPGCSGCGTGWDRVSPEAGYGLGPGTGGLRSGTVGPWPLSLAGAPSDEGPRREGGPAPRCCGTPEPRAQQAQR